MILYWVIGYLVIGYIGAFLYYLKSDTKENKSIKASTIFLFWPILVSASLILLPFAIIDKVKNRKEKIEK